MEQTTFPGMLTDIDNQKMEKEFLANIESGFVKIEFPRRSTNRNHDPDFSENVAYLERYTEEHPDQTFMMFESMDGHFGYLFGHLVKVELPSDQPPAAIKTYLEDFINDLFDNPTEGRAIFPLRRHYYTVVHAGKTYYAYDTKGGWETGFIGDGFVHRSKNDPYRVLGT